MASFLAALAAFLVAHLVPAMPGVRPRLVAALGPRGYASAYSILSLALLAWVIAAARRSDDVALWAPAAWQWVLPFAVMPVAGFLVVAGLMEANPLSVSLRRGDAVPAIARVTRHPVLWGFLLWALAHIPANGRLVPALLFGTMALLSAGGFLLVERKARRRLGAERWRRLAQGTSLLPLASGRLPPLRPLLLPAAIALALYAAFVLGGHAWLIGPDPLDGLRGLP